MQMMEASRTWELMKSLGLVNWETLLTGWDRAWVTKANLIDYAVEQLQFDLEDSTIAVVSLAGAQDLDDFAIRRFLVQLGEKPPDVDDPGLERWRLVRLMELDEMDLEWDQKVTRLEEIGAEFGYPADMRLCTRYGPSKESIDAGLASPHDVSTDPIDTMKQVIAGLQQRLGVKAEGHH